MLIHVHRAAVSLPPLLRDAEKVQLLSFSCLLFFSSIALFFFLSFTFSFFLNILFLERGEGREGEKHQCVVASCMPSNGDLACNPGMYPDWESNQWPFGLQVSAPSPEPHQPGQALFCTRIAQPLCPPPPTPNSSSEMFACSGAEPSRTSWCQESWVFGLVSLTCTVLCLLWFIPTCLLLTLVKMITKFPS